MTIDEALRYYNRMRALAYHHLGDGADDGLIEAVTAHLATSPLHRRALDDGTLGYWNWYALVTELAHDLAAKGVRLARDEAVARIASSLAEERAHNTRRLERTETKGDNR